MATRDRYGFACTFRLCAGCGSSYMDPVYDEAALRVFYRDFYRPLVEAYWKVVPDRESLRADSTRYGHAVARMIGGAIPRNANVLDLGGSTGDAVLAICEDTHARILVYDVNPDELAEARRNGCETTMTLDGIGHKAYDVVVICRTMDHLRAPDDLLRLAQWALKPGGFAYADFVDWESLLAWGLEQSLHVDHVVNFTPTGMAACLARGMPEFRILDAGVIDDGVEVGFVMGQGPGIQWPGPGWRRSRDAWVQELRARDRHPLCPRYRPKEET